MNDFVQTWWPVFTFVYLGFLGAGVYWVRTTIKQQIAAAFGELKKANDDACGRLDFRVDEHHDRISKLESKIDDLPKTADIHALAITIERLSGEIKTQSAKLGAVQETSIAMQKSLQRVNDFLLIEKNT